MRNLVFLLSISLCLVLAGCGDKTTDPESARSHLADPEPDDLEKLVDDLITPDDRSISTGELSLQFPAELMTDGYDMYAVTIVWGQLLNIMPPVTDEIIDWSGRLALDGQGAVSVRHLIDFEAGQDSVLANPDLSSVQPYAAWVSYTNNEFDGLTFLVFVRSYDPSQTPPALSFETEPFSRRWTFDELAKFIAYYPVDNVNGVIVLARRIWTNACPGGFLEGKWIREDNAGSKGRMEGIWTDHSGNPTGVLAGSFWTDDDGRRAFHGWVSGLMTPYVILEFKGTWCYTDPTLCVDCGANHGAFRGEFAYLDGSGNGRLKGVFGVDHIAADIQSLHFLGTWRMNCPLDDIVDNPSGG